MNLRQLLPDPSLKLEQAVINPDQTILSLKLACCNSQGICPACHQPSMRRHSAYERHLTDLPCSGLRVEIHLQVRRFFCTNRECQQRIFSERLPGVAKPYARRSERLNDVIGRLVIAVGVRAAARLLETLRMPASIWSLMRVLQQLAVPCQPTPRVLGVDDWAMRRGRRYGTLLVDMESHAVVDLLPDREAETLATWLRQHPGIEVISRDRAGAYAEGARMGAPGAIQVADRWHLLKNAGDMLARVFDRHHRQLKQVTDTIAPRAAANGAAPSSHSNSPACAVAEQPASKRLLRFQHAHALHKQGKTVSAIARETGLDRKTVHAYLRTTTLAPIHRPSRQQTKRLLPYQSYLLQHWDAERPVTVRERWHELHDHGIRVSLSTVAAFLARMRRQQGLPAYARTALPYPGRPTSLSSKQSAWICLARPEQLNERELQLKALLPDAHPDLKQAVSAAQHFARIVRERLVDEFDGWLQTALKSEVGEVRAFARGMSRDYAAIVAALQLPWSNGLVEGHVNRLKFLKRQMFGRATFALLRFRVLSYRP